MDSDTRVENLGSRKAWEYQCFFLLSEFTGVAWKLVGELYWVMVVKMSRVVFLVPLLIVLFFIGRRTGNKDKIKFPLFIFFFAGAVYTAQLDVFPHELSDKLASLGSFLMAVAMAAIGVGIRIKPLLQISTKGIALGTIVFAIQILMFVGFVLI